MFDKQTESEWLHVTAECMLGPLKGKRLEIVPTQLLSWKEWRLRHPNTTVLQDSESWHSQPTENNDFANKKLRDRIGLNVLVGDSSRLFPLELLESQKVVNDHLEDLPIMATFVSNAKSAVAWSRTVDGKSLRFRALESRGVNQLEDVETETVWDPLTGIGVKGPLKGRQLTALVGIPIRQRRYFDLFPHGSVFEFPKDDEKASD